MTDPMRIAMIGSRGLPATHGGVERAVEALAKRLAARGHEVTVYGRSGYCGTADVAGIHQIVLPSLNTKHFEAATHTMLSTTHALLRERYDIVHFHATGPALFAVAMRLRGVRTVATVHGLDWKREKWGPFATRVLKLAAWAAATIPTETVVVSRQLQRDLSAAYGTNSIYIPNGVDFADLEVPPVAVEGLIPGRFILFLGRLVPEKQPHVLIEAFRGIETDWRLVIAGPSQHAEEYESQLRRAAGEDERVLFVGPQYGSEKAWLLHNARVFVQPSTLEGFPIAPLEALAAGTEVLVSDIPENVEAITIDGRPYARTFRATDVEDLRKQLAPYLDSTSRLGPNAQTAARTAFDWDIITTETEDVYRRALT
jgi:glycosyltransferase involved in cell wall biosynthesis